MADMLSLLQDRFAQALEKALGVPYAQTDPLLRPATHPQFGDYQANLAMGLAKTLGMKPREVAEKIVRQLVWEDVCEEPPGIAGPGFINLKIKPSFLARQVETILSDDCLGVAKPVHPQVVVVDYSGPNVAKDMHVGHLRSTVIGDALARVLAFQGHRVIRQNHLGDWGTQFGRVILGLWYEAAARHNNTESQLKQWMDEVKAIPKGDPLESAEQRSMRLELETTLLSALAKWHQERLDADPDGDLYFEKYVESSFPDIERLQELYAFATSVTGLEAATFDAFQIDHPIHKKMRYDRIPSLIATFVQKHKAIQRNQQEGRAWEKTCEQTKEHCQSLYKRLQVSLTDDDVAPESLYNEDLPGVVSELEQKGLATRSDGAVCVFPPGFVNEEGQPLPLIIQKSDGGYLYATTDLAALKYRVEELHAQRIIYVTDARQKQHFAMVFKTAELAGWLHPVGNARLSRPVAKRRDDGRGSETIDTVRLEHVPFGTVLGEDGKPFKTRSGDTVKLVDLLDEAQQRAMAIVLQKSPEMSEDDRNSIAQAVGIGAIKYADLCNDRIKDYVFSWDRMLSFDGNTAPYLQNAYVRIRSIFRKAGGPGSHAPWRIVQLSEPAEKSLALMLLQFPAAVAGVAEALEPHRLCTYLYELASTYHQFYEKCPVLAAADDSTRQTRLALCEATARTLRKGLELLGIQVIERM